MALVRDTRTWAVDEDDLKTYIGIPGNTDYDVQLQLWYIQAAQEADVYMDLRPWVDDEGADVAQPGGIKVGCFDWMLAVFEAYKNKPAIGGVTSIRTAQLARGFAAPSGSGGGLNMVDIGRNAAAPSWHPYKLDRLRGGMK